MSGTSLDGVDICIAKFTNGHSKMLHFLCLDYPQPLKILLNQFNHPQRTDLKTLACLEKQLALIYCDAVAKILTTAKMQASQISAIGCHGQTVFHDPSAMSIQLGHPAFIAKKTGITTIGDFRIDDIANGGQGAPIAPAFHQLIFKKDQTIAIINIGGIANLSIINAEQAIGFDTGPGNCLMDDICQRYLQLDYDKNGEIAASEAVNKELLDKLLTDDYFKQSAPKSTGRDIFNLTWLEQFLTGKESPAQLVSTLNELTVISLANAIKQYNIAEIVVCGGGSENKTLLKRLEKATNLPVSTTQKYGINPHSLEAYMCAWLAEQRVNKTPIKLMQVTGAKKDSILGGIWEA